ncbi:unnamed protein product [Caenorhabditis angaria]|uniref:PIN domain-containing protein n=1 Tax=Caenorhabditis angaria TaxID=860376 RepID=A0A9P1ID77_9PELO|nr:unnamed protein product [Caenorhabditis angaria]
MNKLKYRKPYLAADLAKVGHQIEGLASNKNAYLELESAAEKLQDFVDFREQQNDLDDSILKCALRVKTELRGELNVTLVTSDTNLLVKAHCNNLNALSTAKFLHKSGYWSQNRYEPHHSRRKRNSQQRRG